MSIFINNAINDAFVMYMKNKKNIDSIEYNSFLVCVVRMLIIIYGEERLMDLFYSKDNLGFDKLLVSYGYNEIDFFKDNFEEFYDFDRGQENIAIKKKNKYFNLVQKALIDMFNCNSNLTVEDRIEFKKLLFTSESEDFYKKSYTLMMAYNPYELDNYMKKINFMGEIEDEKNSN